MVAINNPSDDECRRLAHALKGAPSIAVDIGPFHAYTLIGLLQLALRHPSLPQNTEAVARETIAILRKRLPEACQASIDQGFKG